MPSVWHSLARFVPCNIERSQRVTVSDSSRIVKDYEMRNNHGRNCLLRLEPLEKRLCLTASAGWDGPGQGGAELTYYIDDVPSGMGLDQGEVEAAFESALEVWSDVADITFTETSQSNQADSIDVSFENIDGADGTLAYAYFPDDVNPARIAGDITFDSADLWEVGNNLGSAAFDFLYVAVHELGHSLGLDHSDTSDSVMGDSLSANQQFGGLAVADVDAILALYSPANLTDAPTDPGDDQAGSADPVDPVSQPEDRPFSPRIHGFSPIHHPHEPSRHFRGHRSSGITTAFGTRGSVTLEDEFQSNDDQSRHEFSLEVVTDLNTHNPQRTWKPLFRV